MIHIARWLWFLFRLALYTALGILRFFSKPGSRILVPLALIALAILARPLLHQLLTNQAHALDPGYQPEAGLLDVAAVVAVLLSIIAYYLVSRALSVTLGAFPVAMRPLPPQRKLKPTEAIITSAPVRVVVPPLPKRKR